MLKDNLKFLCPVCKTPLPAIKDGVSCKSCSFELKSIAGIPILRTIELDETIDYYSNKQGRLNTRNSAKINIPRVRKAFERGDFILELGAGIDVCDLPNLVKTDAFFYAPSLDYVVDAHSLPFENDTFDFVYSLAVFEHLHSPWVAAKEIYRVLKPGGKVYILTAFMQHMHGYPSHYFNMTTMGLKRIFSDFEIIKCEPSKYCPLLQIGRIMQDLGSMTKPLTENEIAQELKKSLDHSFNLLVKVQDQLISQPENFNTWHKIAPGVEIAAMKP